MTNKPRTLSGAGLVHQGSFEGVELTGTLPSFSEELKEKLLIYQCFYFAKTAKNAIFGSLLLRSGYNSDKWRFNAWFKLQLRGLVEFFLLVSGFILWRGWVVGWGLGSNFLILKGN